MNGEGDGNPMLVLGSWFLMILGIPYGLPFCAYLMTQTQEE